MGHSPPAWGCVSPCVPLGLSVEWPLLSLVVCAHVLGTVSLTQPLGDSWPHPRGRGTLNVVMTGTTSGKEGLGPPAWPRRAHGSCRGRASLAGLPGEPLHGCCGLCHIHPHSCALQPPPPAEICHLCPLEGTATGRLQDRWVELQRASFRTPGWGVRGWS